VIGVDAAYTSKWGAQHWAKPLQQQTSDPVTRHHAAAAAIGRRGLGMAIRRRPQDPAPDSGPLRAHHRPGPITHPATWVGTAVPATDTTPRGVPVHRRPPPAANTVRAAPEQNPLLLTHEERLYAAN